MGGVELPYPVKFPYPVNVKEIPYDLILGLYYSVKFIKLTYPVKDLVGKSAYLFKNNNNQLQKSSDLNYL